MLGVPIGGAPIAGTTTQDAVVATATIIRPLFLLLDRDGRTTIVDHEDRPMREFWIKRGDTSPALTGQVLDGNRRPVDITGATVRLKARDRDSGQLIIDEAATVDAPVTGQVRYQWVPDDTVTQRELEAEFEVTFADSTVQTWPNPGHVAVHIGADA